MNQYNIPFKKLNHVEKQRINDKRKKEQEEHKKDVDRKQKQEKLF